MKDVQTQLFTVYVSGTQSLLFSAEDEADAEQQAQDFMYEAGDLRDFEIYDSVVGDCEASHSNLLTISELRAFACTVGFLLGKHTAYVLEKHDGVPRDHEAIVDEYCTLSTTTILNFYTGLTGKALEELDAEGMRLLDEHIQLELTTGFKAGVSSYVAFLED